MTYLGFHAVFLLPPLAVLGAVVAARRRRLPRRAGLALVALPLLALVYTTPWDNYLVWRGVWEYGPDRVVGTLGYVPVEEYLFFVLQPLLTGLWLYALMAAGVGQAPRGGGGGGAPRWTGAGVWLLLAAAGAAALRTEATLYLGLILVWAGPVLALQWAYGGRGIAARARLLALGVAVPTVYLWIADAIAIRQGIWRISERYTVGLEPAGLPVEEAVFFLLTNFLVVQGLLLLLHPPAEEAAA